eukprot:3106436-Alexandrium_andersonii.AAC.1
MVTRRGVAHVHNMEADEQAEMARAALKHALGRSALAAASLPWGVGSTAGQHTPIIHQITY